MFVIDNRTNRMRLTKGDTASVNVSIEMLDGKPYELNDKDHLIMTVKKIDGEMAFQKTAHKNVFVLNSKDTSSLPIGLYNYDIQLSIGENIYTIVPKSFFEICDEITL